MSILLQVSSGAKTMGTKRLFEGADLVVHRGEHFGLIGPNGAGKSTFFKCLAGREEFDQGQLTRPSGLTMGYLEQEDREPVSGPALEWIASRCHKAEWLIESNAEAFGLSAAHLGQDISELSGGYQMRCKLLELLMRSPDIILLDEPTNYLDLETLLVLEEFIKNYPGGLILITHDREFLERTTSNTIEIDSGRLSTFKGNVTQYLEYKEERYQQQVREAKAQDRKTKEIMDFANRFRAKATKAKQVQSRLKQLEKMETVQVDDISVRSAKIKIPEPERIGKMVFQMHRVRAGYDQTVILDHLGLTLPRGERWGIVGLNGAGKSTLLKSVAGQIPLLGGEVKFGANVEIAYYAQHLADQLDPARTVYEELDASVDSDTSPQEIRDMAGSLLFQGNDIEKKISVLSGGEKARVALGKVLLQRATCLLLDEPTNHLDFYTVENLTESLANYGGAVITVSHDRSFIRRVATQIVEIDQGTARVYPGDYDAYVWNLKNSYTKTHALQSQESAAAPLSSDSKSTDQATPMGASAKRPNLKHERKRLQQERNQWRTSCQKSQKKIDATLQKMNQLNQELLTRTGEEATKIAKELSNLQFEVVELEDSWLQGQEKLEEIESQLKEIDS